MLTSVIAEIGMNPKTNQRGFILSVEAILIFTILGIGLLVGIVAVRNALVQYSSYRSHNRFIVADSSDPAVVLGQVVGFDPHETPLVPFVDYNPEGEVIEADQVNYRALIGVRPSRFTSRQPVFYTEADCDSLMGAVCLAEPGSEAANATFSASGVMEETGSISYVYPMQSSPSYGIGAGGVNSAGILHRSTANICPADIESVWYSQRPGSNPASLCVNFGAALDRNSGFVEAEPVVDANDNLVLDALTPPFRLNRVTSPTAFTFVPPEPETVPD